MLNGWLLRLCTRRAPQQVRIMICRPFIRLTAWAVYGLGPLSRSTLTGSLQTELDIDGARVVNTAELGWRYIQIPPQMGI